MTYLFGQNAKKYLRSTNQIILLFPAEKSKIGLIASSLSGPALPYGMPRLYLCVLCQDNFNMPEII